MSESLQIHNCKTVVTNLDIYPGYNTGRIIQRHFLFTCDLLGLKVELMHCLVKSTFLYARELWTLKAELQKREQASEKICYQMLLNNSYKSHVDVTNEDVPSSHWRRR